MALFLQIVVFLIIAAALGCAIGWLLRGARLQGEGERLAGDWRSRLGQVEAERDRLQSELAAARTERAPAESSPELEERAARLEQELEAARQAAAEQRAQREAEVGRLEARIAELQVEARTARDAPPAAGTSVNARAAAPVEGAPPPALPGPEGAPDDLKRISGIGPGIEKTLHELGIYHFRQIARFTPENVAWVNQRLRFKGRIEREDWIGQARTLDAES